MAKKLQLRRGTTTQHSSFAGAEGEVTVDTTKQTIVVHNGNGNNDNGIAMAPSANPTFTGTVVIPNVADLESAVVANTSKVTNVTTNLGATANGISLTVTSSDGTNASIPAVTTTAWGVMTDEDKVKLDGVETDADVTDATNVTSAGAGMLDVDQTWTKPQRGFISDLTSPNSNTVTIDFDVANNFQMTPTHGCTFDQPLNQTAGQSGSIFLEVGVGGPFGHGWHADYKWTGGTMPSTWSQTAGKVDRIDYIIRANGEIHCVASVDVFS